MIMAARHVDLGNVMNYVITYSYDYTSHVPGLRPN